MKPLTDLPLHMFETAPEGLAHEMDMLAAGADEGRMLALIWQSKTPWLVLPDRYTRSDPYPPAARASAERGWPVAPRKTGGGITPQGAGVLNLALVFTADPGQSRAIRETYARICDPMTAAFASMGLESKAMPVQDSFCDGDFNLAVSGRKLVGTAQRWRGTTCLIHALILTDVDLEQAVEAVAQFSKDLQHDTKFDTKVHCRLADLCNPQPNINTATVQALGQAVSAAGFDPYQPASAAL